jgi:hypothetical protein
MPLRDTVRVIQSGRRRLKIFVDFWNLVINARKQTSFKLDIHWDKIAEYLVGETRGGYGDKTQGDLAGCYIFWFIFQKQFGRKRIHKRHA